MKWIHSKSFWRCPDREISNRERILLPDEGLHCLCHPHSSPLVPGDRFLSEAPGTQTSWCLVTGRPTCFLFCMADLPLGVQPHPLEALREPPRNHRRENLTESGEGRRDRSSESTGNTVESLQGRSGGPFPGATGSSRSQTPGLPQKDHSLPPGAGSRAGPAAPNAPSHWKLGSRWGGTCSGITSGRREQLLSAQLNTHPPGQRAPSPRGHPCPRGVTLTSNELMGDRVSHSGPRRRPRASAADLVSFSSEPAAAAGSPLPGSRGRGGRGGERLGPGGVPAGWPHKGEPRLAAPYSTLRRAPSAPPAPRLLLKGRARGSAFGRLAERHRK